MDDDLEAEMPPPGRQRVKYEIPHNHNFEELLRCLIFNLSTCINDSLLNSMMAMEDREVRHETELTTSLSFSFKL